MNPKHVPLAAAIALAIVVGTILAAAIAICVIVS